MVLDVPAMNQTLQELKIKLATTKTKKTVGNPEWNGSITPICLVDGTLHNIKLDV